MLRNYDIRSYIGDGSVTKQRNSIDAVIYDEFVLKEFTNRVNRNLKFDPSLEVKDGIPVFAEKQSIFEGLCKTMPSAESMALKMMGRALGVKPEIAVIKRWDARKIIFNLIPGWVLGFRVNMI